MILKPVKLGQPQTIPVKRHHRRKLVGSPRHPQFGRTDHITAR
jgi:hypothetical protein